MATPSETYYAYYVKEEVFAAHLYPMTETALALIDVGTVAVGDNFITQNSVPTYDVASGMGYSRGVTFDGTDDYITTGTGVNELSNPSGCFGFIAKADTFSSTPGYIINIGVSGSSTTGIAVYTHDNGGSNDQIRFLIWTASKANYYRADFNIPGTTTDAHHYIFSQDTTGLKCYIDGVETTAASTATGGTGIDSTSWWTDISVNAFRMGASHGLNDQFYDGTVSVFWADNEPMTDALATKLYNAAVRTTVVDNSYYQYMADTFGTGLIAEYRMDDAVGSSTLADTGSGSVGALTLQSTPELQEPSFMFRDDALDENITHCVDFSGTLNTELGHTSGITSLTSLTQGACVVIYQPDNVQTCDLVITKPETTTGEIFQIALDSSTRSIGCQIDDFAGNRRFLGFGLNANAWDSSAQNTDARHMVIFQYNSTDDEYQVWLDGHQVSGQIDDVATANIDTGTTAWIDTVSAGTVLGIAGRPTYDGLGNFSSSGSNFDGQIEYVAFTNTPFTPTQARELWKRYVGGQDNASTSSISNARFPRRNVRTTGVSSPAAGLDLITFITGEDTSTGTTTFPQAMILERCNQRWICKGHYEDTIYHGHTFPIDCGSESGVDGVIRGPIMAKSGFSCTVWDSNLATSRELPVLGRGGFWRRDTISIGGSRDHGQPSSDNFDPNSISVTGTGREEVYIHPMRTSWTSRYWLCWYWDYATGNGTWTDISATAFDTDITNPGNDLGQSVHYNSTSSYVGIASTSNALDTSSTGGGGIHIYAVSGAGASYALTRQTISGYTPNATDINCVHLWNDGTSDYAIVCTADNTAGGMSNAVDNLAIFKRSGSTWTATANLYNNGTSTLPTGRNYISKVYTVGNSLYVAYDNTGVASGNEVLNHLEWNGTYFADQGNVTNPFESVEDPDVAPVVPVMIYATADEKGVVVTYGDTTSPGSSATPVDSVSNVVGYDRNTSTGVLTYRANWPTVRDPTGLMPFAEVDPNTVGITEIVVEDYPLGRDPNA